MWFDPLVSKSSKKIGLKMYVDNYKPDKKHEFITAAYLVLDNILGEQSNAIEIGHVEMDFAPSILEREKLIELIKLPKYIEWKKAQQTI